MGKPSKQLTTAFLLFLMLPLIQTHSQPLISRESVVDLKILKDCSIELRGVWSKPIRPWEIASYVARGIPLSSDLVYVGNLSIKRQESSGKLRGKLTARIYPRLNPREVRPDIIKELQAENLLTKSKIVDLLAAIYGEDMVVYYGIETELRDMNITSALYGNLTVTFLMINATVESSAKLIDSLNLTFTASRISEDLYVITYAVNLSTSAISLSEKEGHLALDLEPVVNFFPPDTVATIKVNLTHDSLSLIKTHPEATLLTSQYAEILFIPLEKDTVVLYLDKVRVSPLIWASFILSAFIIIIISTKRSFKLKHRK